MDGRAKSGSPPPSAERSISHSLEASREFVAAARALRADATTVEVVTAFRRAEIPTILLKGPVLARWLYPDSRRSYNDSDLMVAPARIQRAEAILGSLGFIHPPRDDIPGDRPWHAHCWLRAYDGANVDLHRTLIGVGVSPHESWRILSRETESMKLSGIEAKVLNPRARALHVALHAAQDGIRLRRPLYDLERALAAVDPSVWAGAIELAIELKATEAFSAGLRLLPEGEALAQRFHLPVQLSTEVRLRAIAAPHSALGFEWLAREPTIRRKISYLTRKLFPSPDFMRAWSRLAHRGMLGLAMAYLWRPIWLGWHAAKGISPWWRAKSAHEDPVPVDGSDEGR